MELHTVNMSLNELRTWADDPRHRLASGPPGWASLRRLVLLLAKPDRKWTVDDVRFARKVDAFNARHLAQQTFGEEAAPGLSRRHIALLNWGHDVRKPSSPAYAAHQRWMRNV